MVIALKENDYYSIRVDPQKNRLYLSLKGFWSSRKKELFEDYIKDLSEELSNLRRGFDAVFDFRTFMTPPMEIGDIHIEAEKIMQRKGMIGAAEVYRDFSTAQLATRRYADLSGINTKAFASFEEAEEWLKTLRE